MTDTDIMALFNEKGIKKTRQRIALAVELGKSQIPVTAEQLYDKHKDMSLSTIYRALELFCEKGIVQKSIIDESGSHYYEMMNNNHRHYAVCLECRKITYVDICPLHDVKFDTGDFAVTSHKLELYGYCEECRENTGKQRKK